MSRRITATSACIFEAKWIARDHRGRHGIQRLRFSPDGAVITALTAQSTVGVEAIHAVPPEMIVEQVRAVAEDIGVDAVKIGMIGSAFAAGQVARRLEAPG